MTKATERTWLLITLLYATVIVSITFPGMLTNPGHIVPGLGGDAGKNIFVYLYHILYDKGIWFSGMNYPYGEHIVYTDARPLLSVPLSYMKHITIAQALGTMWLLIALSYVLAILYVFKILLHFGVRPYIAMLFSGLIVLMNPQLFRTLGHYGLSYACVIPMIFYWTIQYTLNHHWKYAVYFFILGFIVVFLHPYLAGIMLVWTVFYAVGYFIFTAAPLVSKLKHVLPLVASIGFVFFIIRLILQFTDPIKDRPSMPYGLTAYCTTGPHILTSHYSPVWRFMEDNTTIIKNKSFEEGFCYLGIIVIAVFIFSLVTGIAGIRKKNTAPGFQDRHPFQRTWFFMAFAALIFSMGVPFVWGMEWIVNYLPFIAQFRTLGRFSWIFYYILTIYAVIVIDRYYSIFLLKNKKNMAYALLIITIGLWSYEASGYIIFERKALGNSEHNYEWLCGKPGNDWRQFLDTNHYKPADFQAILLLPFFDVGSDKLWVGGASDEEMMAGFESGIQLQLPIVDEMMGRASWSITEKQVKIAAGPYVEKPMLKDLKNKKPFLLINYEHDDLDPDQKYLLLASDYIGKYDEWRVYACYPERITANDKKHTDSIMAVLPYLKNRDTCINCSGTWYVDHFDSGKAKETFFGSGAQPQIMRHETVIANIPVSHRDANQPYEFSCWFLLGNENYRSPYFKLDMLDAAGNVITSTDVLTKESTDNKGLWFRASRFFSIPPNCAVIRCRLFNDPDNAYKVMDEMLLRPLDALIISKSADGNVMVNNHLLAQ